MPRRARSTPSSGRTGPGSRRCSASPAACSRQTRRRRDRGSRLDDGLGAREAQHARPGHGVPDVLGGARAVGRGEPLPRDAVAPAAVVRRRWRRGPRRRSSRVRPAGRPDGADGQPAARRAADARGRQGAAPEPKVLAARRADDGARARRGRAAARARRSTCAARGVGVIYVSHRLLEVLSVAHRVTVLRDGVEPGHLRRRTACPRRRLVALMIGRPLELAFPDRDRRGERERAARRRQSAGRPLRADRPDAAAGARSSASPARRATGRSSSCDALAGVERSVGTVTL